MRPVAILISLVNFASLGCGPDAWADVTRQPDRTEVVFIASLHRGHLHHEDYPMSMLEKLVRAVEPEVVIAEIPPAGRARIEAALAAEQPDPWLESFPELSQVVYPLHRELGFELVAASAWERQVSDDWSTYWAAHPNGPDAELYQNAATHFARVTEDEDDDPEWLHSPTYRRLAAWTDTALSSHAGDELGAADPIRLGRRHAAAVVRAILAHQGRRIAVVWDARKRWILEREVQTLSNVTIHDTRWFIEQIEDAED